MEERLNEMDVMKRNSRRTSFDGTKIAIAIQKGFNSIEDENGEKKYSAKDTQKIYQQVLKRIEKDYLDSGRIRVEEIQDLIEEELKKEYPDVYESFVNYREMRSQSRKMFADDKKLHKFVKTIEGLGLKPASEDNTKRENANVDGDTAMGTMLQYGSTVSKEFAKSYLIKKKHTDMHDEGVIHIHDLDFYPMGTTTCTQIDLDKLFHKGFSTGHGFIREPQNIMSYAALAAIAIQSNQNDQHGGQSIPAFDYYMAPGVLKTFKKQLKQQIADFLSFSTMFTFVDMDKVVEKIDKVETIDIEEDYFDEFIEGNELLERLFAMSIERARLKTKRLTYQAMESFIHNLNTMHSRAGAQVPFSSLNFGTDTSSEGRMVMKAYLNALDSGLGNGETPIFPISIFKVKEGVNYNEEDPNYDIFKQSCEVSAKRLFPNFSFIDAPFNKAGYDPNDYKTEVGYMGCRTRVLSNIVDPKKAITPGRGNLSFTSINLPRLGIKHGIIDGKKTDMKGFYDELDDIMEEVKNQLLNRFELQCRKHPYNFPFLIQEGNWIDSEKLSNEDFLRRTLKHGTLTVGFIGLAECLKALIGKHHGEGEDAQKLGLEIIQHMRAKTDEFAEKYKLNFSLIATPAEGLSGRFVALDQAIYGKIKGVTDRKYYTNSFHVPVYYKATIKDKIETEAPYHNLTNGGHITYIELDGDLTNNTEAFISVVRKMKEAGIGYGAINHPVDRDPVCGFVGIINESCPKCGRKEGEGVPIERLSQMGCSIC